MAGLTAVKMSWTFAVYESLVTNPVWQHKLIEWLGPPGPPVAIEARRENEKYLERPT